MQPCLKQSVEAIIFKGGILYAMGRNDILNDEVKECPRKDMPSGVGYDLCEKICKQLAHAEAEACRNYRNRCTLEGIDFYGATLFLFGHTYACDKCIEIMKRSGIIKLVIVDTKEEINLENLENIKENKK